MSELSPDARKGLLAEIRSFFDQDLDVPIGDLRAELVLSFFEERVAPTYYNLGVADARAFFDDKLLDLEAVVRKEPRSRRP